MSKPLDDHSKRQPRVYAIKRESLGYYVVRIVYPGRKAKQKRLPKEVTRRRDAERYAHDLEQQLCEELALLEQPTWPVFRKRYETEKLTGTKNREAFESAANLYERLVGVPERLQDVTPSSLSVFGAKMRAIREGGRPKYSEQTVKSYLIRLRTALTYAVKMEWLHRVPYIDVPRIPDQMAGRPLSDEEFERMLEVTPDVVGEADADSWRFLLRGLWLSGLRLGEAIALSWEPAVGLHVPYNIDSDRPMIDFAATQKNRRATRCAITPDFAEFLRSVPASERTGRVFKPVVGTPSPRHRTDSSSSITTIGRRISRIGRAAGIQTKASSRDGVEVIKYASSHDFRRSFGARWATEVEATILMELMRHSNIHTTMTFYVGRNAERTADIVREAWERKLGVIDQR